GSWHVSCSHQGQEVPCTVCPPAPRDGQPRSSSEAQEGIQAAVCQGPMGSPRPQELREGGRPMHPTLHILLVVALGGCLYMPLHVFAASGMADLLPSAVSMQPPDTFTTHPGGDQHSPTVLVRVHALVPEKVTLSDPAQGTVRATVLGIDAQINQVKVQTD